MLGLLPLLPALSALPLAAPAQELVENINTKPLIGGVYQPNADPREFTQVGQRVYFSAWTEATGRELFWMPLGGGTPQLLADVEPGPGDSNPAGLVAMPGDRLFFVADTLTAGFEFWVSDGTEAGTVQPLDIAPGPGDSYPQRPTLYNGEVWFYARDNGEFSPSLFRTDGTTQGTSNFLQLGLTGSYSGGAIDIEAAGNWLYFFAGESVWPQGRWRLWRTGGDAASTLLLADEIEPDWYGPRELTRAGANVAFLAQGSQGGGQELWVSDGSVVGTQQVELNPGPDNSFPSDFLVVGDEAYFLANHPIDGREIFRTDGTPLGTQQVTATPGSFFGGPLWLNEAHGQIFYSAFVDGEGYELWTSSGTLGSEWVYAVFNPGSSDANVFEIAEVPGGIVASAQNDSEGTELWFSDGSPAGTYQLTDIALGANDADPSELTAIAGEVYFSANGDEVGNEPFVTDGTVQGTLLVDDMATVPFDQGSYPRDYVSIGSTMLFVANDGLRGNELWRTDWPSGATTLVKDISSDPFDLGPRFGVPFDGRMIFTADDEVNGRELWISDGTLFGTTMLHDVFPGFSGSSPYPLGSWRGEFYFGADPPGIGNKFYKTDGTPGGLTLLADVSPASRLGNDDIVPFGDWLYFAATQTNITGRELWRTDGTNTELVIDLNPGGASSMSYLEAAVYGDHLYFSANDGVNGQELWRTDGTAAGTELVADIDTDGTGYPHELQVVNDKLFFLASPDLEDRLFAYDGSTVEALSGAAVEFRSNWPLFNNGSKVMSIVTLPGKLRVLWGSDGTLAGSGEILTINVNDNTSFVNLRVFDVLSDGKVLFSAADPAFGAELWVTDGTTAGTQQLTDINPGPLNSSIEDLGRRGGDLFFYATQPEIGFELWSLSVSSFGANVAETFGFGCAGSNGLIPDVVVTGSAAAGDVLTVEIADAAPASAAAHFLALGHDLGSFGGCNLHLADPTLAALTPTDALGATTLPVPIPPVPALAGLEVWWQAVVADAGGAANGIASITPALEVVIGE